MKYKVIKTHPFSKDLCQSLGDIIESGQTIINLELYSEFYEPVKETRFEIVDMDCSGCIKTVIDKDTYYKLGDCFSNGTISKLELKEDRLTIHITRQYIL